MRYIRSAVNTDQAVRRAYAESKATATPQSALDTSAQSPLALLAGGELDRSTRDQLVDVRKRLVAAYSGGAVAMQWGVGLIGLATLLLVACAAAVAFKDYANGYVSPNLRDVHIPAELSRSAQLDASLGKTNIARAVAYAERAQGLAGEACDGGKGDCATFQNLARYMRVQAAVVKPSIHDNLSVARPTSAAEDLRELIRQDQGLGFKPIPQVLWAAENHLLGAPQSATALSASNKTPSEPFPWRGAGMIWGALVSLGALLALRGRLIQQRASNLMSALGVGKPTPKPIRLLGEIELF